MKISQGEFHLSLARTSLRQVIQRYHRLQKETDPRHPEMIATIHTQLENLTSQLNKLEQATIRIAVFGLVSRGKSAVLNALLGQKILQTGPLHGVTQWPRSIRWSIYPEKADKNPVYIELIDTPGLDEIGGEIRSDMAKEITRQSDLILFVVAGDITRTESEALKELRQAQKPLILVFNKIDLYPDVDQQAIYENLQNLAKGGENFFSESVVNLPDEIVMIAAEPAPIQVRVEKPNGEINYEWETPPPYIEPLKQTLLKILNREGRSLLALNALVQGRDAEKILIEKTMNFYQEKAEDLIMKFATVKGIAIALNPIAILDIFGGMLTDLLLIRALAKLYNLPMTNYQATELWQKILWSSGGVLLGELVSGFLLGFEKTSSIALGEGLPNYTTAAMIQGGLGAYGSYVVGKATQVYLENGCTWGPLGQNYVIQNILNQVDKNSIIYRLQQLSIKTD